MVVCFSRQCARVVLDIKWQQLDESNQCRQNFLDSLSTCHQLMAPRGFTRFGVVQSLTDNPWTDPVLTMVMGSEEDNEEGEGLFRVSVLIYLLNIFLEPSTSQARVLPVSC